MAKIDYQALYQLQDQVLEIMFRNEVSFYLTGGTCLHRFHFKKRYSDDLDFFSNENELFREDARVFLEAVSSENMLLERTVDTRDFVRVVIDNQLKIDLVNDRVYRYRRPERCFRFFYDLSIRPDRSEGNAPGSTEEMFFRHRTNYSSSIHSFLDEIG